MTDLAYGILRRAVSQCAVCTSSKVHHPFVPFPHVFGSNRMVCVWMFAGWNRLLTVYPVAREQREQRVSGEALRCWYIAFVYVDASRCWCIEFVCVDALLCRGVGFAVEDPLRCRCILFVYVDALRCWCIACVCVAALLRRCIAFVVVDALWCWCNTLAALVHSCVDELYLLMFMPAGRPWQHIDVPITQCSLAKWLQHRCEPERFAAWKRGHL